MESSRSQESEASRQNKQMKNFAIDSFILYSDSCLMASDSYPRKRTTQSILFALSFYKPSFLREHYVG
jgi:hypothetical protein